MTETTPDHEHSHTDGTTHAHEHDEGHHDSGAPVEHHLHQHTHDDGTAHEHEHGSDHQHD